MPDNTINRRRFLELGAAGAAAVATVRLAPAGAQVPETAGSPGTTHRPVADPFTLGVASGDPAPDGVVLWTRLAPDPLAGGGMPDRRVPVQWEVARDERFRRVVARGTEVASADLAHSVHAEVTGLRPASWYWYRFRVGRTISPVGRTRTAPAAGAPTPRLAFAVTSCQNYPAGYYTAHRHMAAEDLDLVVQVGDYIYEGPPGPNQLRPHEGAGEPLTLESYRNRHAQYKTDPDLQASHAAFPWAVVLDDHEIDNNWADEVPQDPALQPPEVFLARRAAALQAYYDNYVPERNSLRDHVVAAGTSNPVVLTGDVHAAYVCDVKADFDDPASATVATELVGSSITSGGDGVDQLPGDAVQLAENPHIRFINRKRGYIRNVVTPEAWTADYRIVDQVTVPGSPVATRASFVIEDGRPGAVPA